MRILKREVSSLHDDDQESSSQDNASAPQFPQSQLAAAPAPVDQQAQIDALQQQIRDMQRSAAMDTPAPEPQHTQPS
jgi:hypothetical protein